MMKTFYKALDFISEWLGMIFTSAMCLGIAIQVIWRYVFNHPLSWPEEISRYLFLWSTYAAISICMNGDEHLRITIIKDMLSKRGKKIIDIIAQLTNIFFFLLVVKLSADVTLDIKDMEQMAVSLPLPIWIVWAGIPILCFFTFMQSLRNLYLIYNDRLHRKNQD